MKLILARHLWGTTAPYSAALQLYKQQGYNAIEAGLLYSAEPADQLLSQIHELDMRWIAMIFTDGNTVKDHLASFKKQVTEAARYQPLLINSHSGRDAFSQSEAHEFFQEAIKIEKEIGIPIAHETHRSRILFNPWITRDMLQAFPELHLCCDYSHWVTVCERLIHDQIEILKTCAKHAIHIHARVGHEQGPQVSDPRAPEFATHVEAHESWWDLIWEAQRQAGKTISTLTPEFGPWPYLPTLPYTQLPMASQDEICYWQAQRQKIRFEKFLNQMTAA